ncbi:MAG: acyl carrier protein [Clostridia bacterium]|nr:acyl carrier protein [Clostridia bacterium]
MLDTIKEILAKQLRIDENDIDEDTLLREDLGVDSLDVVEMLMAIEDECGVMVPDDEIANLKTVGDVAKYVEENK